MNPISNPGLMPGNAANVNELLALNDIDFVTRAYQVVLRRPADPSGRANYLSQVRAGIAKENILVEMAQSDEGRKAASDLNGLVELIAAHASTRLTLLQRIVRRLSAAQTAEIEVSVRRLENLVARIAAETEARFDQIQRQVADLSNATIRAASASQPLDGMNERQTDQRAHSPAAQATTELDQLTPQQRLILRKLS